MTKTPITVAKLLATYWLDSENQIVSPEHSLENLRRFTAKRGIETSDVILGEAADHLNGKLSKGDVDQWVTFITFFAHPNALWNFMLDAVAAAENDDQLEKIAASLAEHILAHYGSTIPRFEAQALRDSRFKRMLTGVWRHRMSDHVWMRLRAIQSDVHAPLSNMIPLEHGVDYMSDSLSQDDRKHDDKGRYILQADGDWKKRLGRAKK